MRSVVQGEKMGVFYLMVGEKMTQICVPPFFVIFVFAALQRMHFEKFFDHPRPLHRKFFENVDVF